MQRERDGPNRPQIGRHVLAGCPVAPRRATDEPPAVVAQADGQAVDLQLADIRHWRVVRLATEAAPNPHVELAQLVGAERVPQAEHRHVVTDGWEPTLDRSADPLGRRVLAHELGIRGLELGQLPEQAVVVAVADGGGVEDVVPVIRLIQQATQLLDAGGGFGGRHRARFYGPSGSPSSSASNQARRCSVCSA